MKIHVYNSYEEMSCAAADFVAAQLVLNPALQLGLTAGKTPIGMFAELVRLYQAGKISFAKASFYNLEEMVGYAPDAPESCRSFLNRHLLEHVDAQPGSLYLPDGMANDVEAECAKYDALFNNLPDGRLDTQILGIGSDGHIGCNRPAEELISVSHTIELSPGNVAAAMGVRSIMLAKTLVLIANGESKSKAIADMCSGKITTAVPATLLQLHPDVHVFLDKAAASML